MCPSGGTGSHTSSISAVSSSMAPCPPLHLFGDLQCRNKRYYWIVRTPVRFQVLRMSREAGKAKAATEAARRWTRRDARRRRWLIASGPRAACDEPVWTAIESSSVTKLQTLVFVFTACPNTTRHIAVKSYTAGHKHSSQKRTRRGIYHILSPAAAAAHWPQLALPPQYSSAQLSACSSPAIDHRRYCFVL